MQKLFFILVTLVLMFSPSINADEFSDVYKQYSQALKDGDKQKIQKFAVKAVELGETKFGAEHKNTANLKHNLAKAYFANKSNLKAFEQMSTVIALYEKIHGENSEQQFFALLDQLSFHRPDQKMKYPQRVEYLKPYVQHLIDVSGKFIKDIPDVAPAVYFELSKTFNKPPLVNLANKHAKEYAKIAYVSLVEAAGSEDIRTLEAQLYLANAMKQNRDFNNAQKFYDDIINKLPKNHSLVQQVRKKLVNDGPRPIIRIIPKYPEVAAKKGLEGWVEMSFTISKAGNVQDVKVIDSKGKVFEKQAVRALTKWKYKPQLDKNGEAVERKGLSIPLIFNLAKLSRKGVAPRGTSGGVAPIVRIEPKYPAEAAKKGKEGWVKMSFTVSKKGTVEDVKVIDSKGGFSFEKEAVRALKRWKYRPKLENSLAVKQKNLSVTLIFKLNN